MTHFSAIFSLLWWNKTKSEISEVQVANGCILPWWNGKEKVQSGFSSKNNSYGEAKRYKVAYRQILGYWQYFVPNLCNNIAYSVLYVCALFMYYITHCTNLKSSDYVIILMKLFISHLKVKVTWSFLTLCNPMDCTCQVPLSMEFSGQEHWHGNPFSPSEHLPNPEIKPRSLVLAGRFSTVWGTREAHLEYKLLWVVIIFLTGDLSLFLLIPVWQCSIHRFDF